jgi:hypothetical protein
MSKLVREVSEHIARQTESRRSFLGRVAKYTFAAAAAVVTQTGIGTIANAACGCTPPGGNYCVNWSSSYCNSYGECAGGCTPNLTWYPGSGGCWSDACGFTCCDCSCPGGVVCGCRSQGVAPVGGLGAVNGNTSVPTQGAR